MLKKIFRSITRFTAIDLLLPRWFIALLLTFFTYNPLDSGWGFTLYNYATADPANPIHIVGLLIVIFAILHIVFIWMAASFYGVVGTVIFSIFSAAAVYFFVAEEIISVDLVTIKWVMLIIYTLFLAVGTSGAIVRRRSSGQLVVDEAE